MRHTIPYLSQKIHILYWMCMCVFGLSVFWFRIYNDFGMEPIPLVDKLNSPNSMNNIEQHDEKKTWSEFEKCNSTIVS